MTLRGRKLMMSTCLELLRSQPAQSRVGKASWQTFKRATIAYHCHWHCYLVSRIYENKPFKTFLVPVDPKEVNLFENSAMRMRIYICIEYWKKVNLLEVSHNRVEVVRPLVLAAWALLFHLLVPLRDWLQDRSKRSHTNPGPDQHCMLCPVYVAGGRPKRSVNEDVQRSQHPGLLSCQLWNHIVSMICLLSLEMVVKLVRPLSDAPDVDTERVLHLQSCYQITFDANTFTSGAELIVKGCHSKAAILGILMKTQSPGL